MTTATLGAPTLIAGGEWPRRAKRGWNQIGPQNRENEFALAVMSRFALARSIQSPHQECQIARGGLNQQFLVRVVAASHVQLVHTSRVELMCKVSLHPFPARGLQSFADKD